MPKQNISHICDYCGKEHFIDRGTYNKLISGKNKNSYCSIQCKSMAQSKKDEVVCTNCGKHTRDYISPKSKLNTPHCDDETLNLLNNEWKEMN